MPGKLSEHRGQALAGADGGRAYREIQGVTGDSGSRLHLPGHQEGVREPGEVESLVPGVEVVVPSQGGGEDGNGPERAAWLRSAAARHDVQLCGIHPRGPVWGRLALPLLVERGVGGRQVWWRRAWRYGAGALAAGHVNAPCARGSHGASARVPF
ncbi:hypothetical protein GCM10010415_38190 [Streptomyces atrovirens]